MKKILFAALSMLLVIGMVLTGCGSNEGGNDGSLDNIKTMQDVFNLIPTDDVTGKSIHNNHYVMIFKYMKNEYRVWAELTDAVYQQLFDLDFFDPDIDQKERDLVKDFDAQGLTNLTAAMPSEDDLKKYVGKTGQELVDMGFTCHGFMLWGDAEFYLDFGDYGYKATMNEKLDSYDEDASYEEIMAHLTVKKMECTGVGQNATDLFME